MTFAQWFLLLGDAQDDAYGASLGMVQREVLGTAKEDADGGAVGEELREARLALEGQTEAPPLRSNYLTPKQPLCQELGPVSIG